jgi:3-hydroxyisobutyrate dehydrogenase-like beta-hydroxyacid dehydrogenase
MTTVAFIGLDDTALCIAEKLSAAGISVVGYSSQAADHPKIEFVSSAAEATPAADVVFSGESHPNAVAEAEKIIPLMSTGALLVDLHAGTPQMKKQISELCAENSFVDMAVVSDHASGDPVFHVSGPGAQRLHHLLESSTLNLEVVSDVAGDATARKILRSLLDKALAGAVIDYLWAAESLGMDSWAIHDAIDAFEHADENTLQAYLTDTSQNFKRLQIDMVDINESLTATGYESTVVAPIQFTYGRIMHGKKIPHAKKP